MDPLQQFLDFITQLKTQANATLKSLPPLEQFEASQELSYCFRSLTAQANNLIEFADNATKSLTLMVGKIKDGASAEAKSGLIASGEFISKADHEAAVAAGKISKETEVRTAIEAESRTRQTVAERRQKLIADKVLPAIAAERLSETVLAADDFAASAGKVAARLKKFADIGITAEKAPSVVGEVAALALDDAGEALLMHRLKFCQEAGASSARGTGSGINPLAGSAAVASAEGAASVASGGGKYRASLL